MGSLKQRRSKMVDVNKRNIRGDDEASQDRRKISSSKDRDMKSVTQLNNLGNEINLLRLLTKYEDSGSLHNKDGGVEIKEFVKKVFQNFDNVMQEYETLKKEGNAPNTTTKYFDENPNKNRYIDIKCYDHTRVILKDGLGNDYIHANFADGYKTKKMYICCQGPLVQTFLDFWRMIWQEETMVIAMTTKCFELGKAKCGSYWPYDASKSLDLKYFQVICKRTIEHTSYRYTELFLKNVSTKETRAVVHLLYQAWPDCGVPLNSNVFLAFTDVIRKTQMALLDKRRPAWKGRPQGPPIVVHCSAGIGRTGTLCAVDICCRKLVETGMVEVMETVRRLRSQRAMSVQKPEQYMFVCLTVIQFAITYKLLNVSADMQTDYHKAQGCARNRADYEEKEDAGEDAYLVVVPKKK